MTINGKWLLYYIFKKKIMQRQLKKEIKISLIIQDHINFLMYWVALKITFYFFKLC